MKHAITILLCLALAQCGLSPAWADTVALPDAPDPIFEPGGPDSSDLTSLSPAIDLSPTTDLAMIYHVPTDASAEVMTPRRGTLPLAITAGTGSDTRLTIDMSGAKAQVEEEGWGWKTWTAIGVCAVAVIAASAIFIVRETQDHGGGDDSGTHIDVSGDNNRVHIGPSYQPSTSTSTTTTTMTTGGEW
jgi:hypothetical protein